jgi:hypothetical protein
MGSTDVGTSVSLTLGVYSDFSQFAHVMSFSELCYRWCGIDVDDTWFKMERGGGGVISPTRSFRASIGIIESVSRVSSGSMVSSVSMVYI